MKNNYYSLQLHVHGKFVKIAQFWSNPGDYSEEDMEFFFRNYFSHYYGKVHRVPNDDLHINSLEVNNYNKSVFINYEVVIDGQYVSFKEKFYFKYLFFQNNKTPNLVLVKKNQ